MEADQVAAIDLSGILDSSHENRWVAIAPDYSRILETADSLGDLMQSVKDKDAIFHRVLPHDVSFAPSA